MTKLFKVECARCGGGGQILNLGTCFKCNGSGVNQVTTSQYKTYITKNVNASNYIMINTDTAEIVKLKESEECEAVMNHTFANVNGVKTPVVKIEINNEKYVAIKYSYDYKTLLSDLTIIILKKLGLTITNEKAKELVNNSL